MEQTPAGSILKSDQGGSMASDKNRDYQERAEKQFVAEGEMKSIFSMLGDTIAEDQGYEDLRGDGCGVQVYYRQVPLASPPGQNPVRGRPFTAAGRVQGKKSLPGR
jgi:hypothetical protein